MNHNLLKNSAKGHGTWMQCKHCGMAHHGGFYWLAGYKSVEAPPCDPRCGEGIEAWMGNPETVKLSDGDTL